MKTKIQLALEKYNNILLLLVFFTIPLFPKLNTVLIIVWCISSVIIFKRNQFYRIIQTREIILFFIFYFFLVVGVIYSTNISEGLLKLETQISLIVFPIFLGSRENINKKFSTKILYSFSFGCIIAGLICFVIATYKFLVTEELYIINAFGSKQNIYFYNNFSEVLDIHPSYLSICFSIASLFILNQFLFKKEVKYKKTHLFLFLFLIIINLMLASKAGILSFTLIYIGYLLLILKKSSKKKVIRLFFIPIIIFTIFFCFNSTLSGRFTQGISSLEDVVLNDKKINDPVGIRYHLWETSFYASKENFFFGTGTGNVRTILYEECIKRNFFSDCEMMRGMNSHNQYLNILIANGIVGLILFILILFYLFKKAIKKDKTIFLIFLLLFVINMFFESLLQREKGIILFMSFTSLLIANSLDLKSEKKKL